LLKRAELLNAQVLEHQPRKQPRLDENGTLAGYTALPYFVKFVGASLAAESR
jgi:hypothetical protein